MRSSRRAGKAGGAIALVACLLGVPGISAWGQAPARQGAKTTAPVNETHPLDFAQKGFADAMVGVPFHSSVLAVGGSGLFTFTVSGDLPPGLFLESGANTVAVSGVPTKEGEFSLDITIRDINGAGLTRTFPIHVDSKKPGLQLLPAYVTDAEGFKFSDSDEVFFPVVIVVNEAIHVTDQQKDLDAILLVVNEGITVTDTIGAEESVMLPVNESITVTDTISTSVAWKPILAVAKSHTGSFTAGSTAVWNIRVTNNAGIGSAETSGTTTVVDTLPTGYTMAAFNGLDWTCSGSNTVTCTSPEVIEGSGGAFPLLQLTVNVPDPSPASVTNHVVAYGGGDPFHTNASNGATASDTAAVNPEEFQLTISANPATGGTVSTASGLFVQGTVVPISATPNTGYTFLKWTSSPDSVASPNSASTTIPMNAPETVTAQFSANLVVNTATDSYPGNPMNCTPQTVPGTNGTDSACGLRDALAFSANAGAATITFDSKVFASAKTISLLGGSLFIPSNTNVIGPFSGSGATRKNLVTVNGSAASSDFTVNSGVTSTSLAYLVITNGAGTSGAGGGINNLGTLSVVGSTISGNSVSSSGQASGGGISNSGTLIVSSSTLSGNSVTALNGQASGGAIANNSGAVLIVYNTTLANNSATAAGDGDGGAIANIGGKVTTTNTTISGNSADGAGGGISGSSGTVILENTVVSGNTGGDVSATYTGTGNVISSPSMNLAPLGNFGGQTQTLVPLPGSSAICAGIAANAASFGISTDQRGFPFDPHCPSGSVDAGAVQSHYVLSFSTSPNASQSIEVAFTPSPVVELEESGSVATHATSSVTMSDSASVLAGTQSVALSGGSALFNNLHLSAIVTNDTLTATLTLTPTINLAANPANKISTGTPGSTISTPALSFGSVNVGSSSNSQSLTLTNTGNATLTITSIAVTGADASSFVFANNCGTSLAAGANCTIHGHFAPTMGGALSADITITTNAYALPQNVVLSGTGIAPAPSLSATSLSYASTIVGESSGSQVVTMTNNTSAAVPIGSIAVTGTNASSFVFANSCGTSLAVGANCTVHGHFAPVSTGALKAAVTITYTGTGSPMSIALSGTGLTPPVTLSAASLSFGSVDEGATSASQTVVVTNSGTAAVTITSIALTGTNASSFVFANSCGTSLAVGATCTIHGHFAPTVTGALTAAIKITDSAITSPQSIALSGTGVTLLVSLSAKSLTYPATAVGSSSGSQSVTMTNTGTAAVSIASIALTGTDASSFVFANNCGTSLAVGASCIIHGHFAPVATGALTASVTITDSATGSPQTITLTGTGQ